MTSKERELAIDIFEDNFTVIDTHGHYTEEEECLAIDMAIKALEQKPKTIQEIQAESEKYQKAFEDGYEQGYAQARFDYEQEPCEDCISRQAVIDGINEYFHDEYYQRTSIQDCRDCLIEDVIKDIPPVRPQEPFDIETYCKEHFCVMVDKDLWEKAERALKQEPKTGHWFNSKVYDNFYICSECGESGYNTFKYCPNCGAKMKVGE